MKIYTTVEELQEDKRISNDESTKKVANVLEIVTEDINDETNWIWKLKEPNFDYDYYKKEVNKDEVTKKS